MRHLLRAAIVVLLAAAAAAAQPVPEVDLDALLKASADAYQRGDPAKGFALLETVRDRAHALGQPATEIESLLRLSLSHTYRNDFGAAAALLSRARTVAVDAGLPEDEGRVILQQAALAQSRIFRFPTAQAPSAPPGESPAALARVAWDRFKALRSTRGMALAADALAYYLEEGPEKDAMRTEALALPRVDGHPAACKVVHQWGDRLFTDGRLAEAYTQLVSAIGCFAARGDYSEEANTHVSLGRVFRARGRLKDALAEYERAQVLHGRPGNVDHRGAVQAMNAVAVTFQAMGRYDEARARLEAALAKARLIAPSTVPFLLANLSALNSSTGHYAEALAGLDEALQGDPATPYLARRRQQRAFALAKLGRREEALAEVTRAVELSKTMGPEEIIGPPRLRAQLLGEAGRFDEAEADLRVVLDTIERVRANAVPSDLMRRGFTQSHQSVFATAIDVLGLQHKAGAALETAERARARAFLDLRAEQAKTGVAATPATVADAQRLAARLGSTIVAYWVGETTLSIWVVRPGQPVQLARVPVLATRLTTLVRGASGVDTGTAARGGLLITDRAQRAPWRELESLLLVPVAKWLPAKPGSRLTIVPHGPLFGLSFAGLRAPGGRYLLERHDLHYVPAIAVLSAAGPRRSTATGALLVGDPGPIEGEPGTEALPALPWAKREVESVRASLGQPTTLLLGEDATEGRVRPTLAGRRVLHFATHAVVSNEPNRPSYLALHAAAGDDGRFSADEIYGSTLDADLVVLSACRTALGPVEGDGVIGFTRAFLSAGARSVVATQWDVSDQISYDVMRGFYARRARGLSTSRALRGAQLAVLGALRRGAVMANGVALPETPRLWAGFILTGEP